MQYAHHQEWDNPNSNYHPLSYIEMTNKQKGRAMIYLAAWMIVVGMTVAFVKGAQ